MRKSRLGGVVRFGWRLGVAFLALAGAVPGMAQTAGPGEAEALRAEMRAMKADYEQRIRQMEERRDRLAYQQMIRDNNEREEPLALKRFQLEADRATREEQRFQEEPTAMALNIRMPELFSM